MKRIFVHNRLFLALLACVVLFIFANYYPVAFTVARYLLLFIATLGLVDLIILFIPRNAVIAHRNTPERLSNGDENIIQIKVESYYQLPLTLSIIDEIPLQFQVRDFCIKSVLGPSDEKVFSYTLKPTRRGVYSFGKLNVYVSSPIRFFERRYIYNEGMEVPVYPSFIQMRKYELLAISNKLSEAGIKRIRRIGRHTEFDQIREYVKGDDYRTMNWKATARKADFMVNQYQDERSQQVYAIIDMGRVMKMPFEGMTLLDYAINTSLAILNIAMKKHDKAGLITFTEAIETVIPADRKGDQMIRLMEMLYAQKTRFLESNYELLYVTIKRTIRQRSLLIFYTNFESLPSMQRQLPYFKRLAKSHLVLVVFFENTEISRVLEQSTKTLDQIYNKTIAEKFIFEKKQIVKQLQRQGIYALLTTPSKLTVDTINTYLGFKARGLI